MAEPVLSHRGPLALFLLFSSLGLSDGTGTPLVDGVGLTLTDKGVATLTGVGLTLTDTGVDTLTGVGLALTDVRVARTDVRVALTDVGVALTDVRVGVALTDVGLTLTEGTGVALTEGTGVPLTEGTGDGTGRRGLKDVCTLNDVPGASKVMFTDGPFSTSFEGTITALNFKFSNGTACILGSSGNNGVSQTLSDWGGVDCEREGALPGGLRTGVEVAGSSTFSCFSWSSICLSVLAPNFIFFLLEAPPPMGDTASEDVSVLEL